MTTHEKTVFLPENMTVIVTLLADRASKFSSLDQTCNRHFMEWQRLNYSKLGYKSCQITECKKEYIEGNEKQYFYSLVYKLKGARK